MKSIVAVLRPSVVGDLKTELEDCGVTGMTVTAAEGYGRQRGHTEVFRGAEYSIDFVPKLRVELLVSDDQVEQVVRTIMSTARTGRIGDGKIWIMPVDTLIGIRISQPDISTPSLPPGRRSQ